MVVTNPILTAVKTAALAEFDSASHIGFGTGNTAPNVVDTDLDIPLLRKAFDEGAAKNIGNGTYDFSATMGLTEGNGNTIKETGLFDAASGGNLFIRELLTTDVVKDVSKELTVGLRITITVTNV